VNVSADRPSCLGSIVLAWPKHNPRKLTPRTCLPDFFISVSYKPQNNVLISDNGTARLTDVGIESALCHVNPVTTDGWRWKAPETMAARPIEEDMFTPHATKATDVYSYAHVCYSVGRTDLSLICWREPVHRCILDPHHTRTSVVMLALFCPLWRVWVPSENIARLLTTKCGLRWKSAGQLNQIYDPRWKKYLISSLSDAPQWLRVHGCNRNGSVKLGLSKENTRW
jgi:serine/threonine protein kinase